MGLLGCLLILDANNSRTTVIARLDSDGCLEPGCGVFNDITSYLTSTKTIDRIDFEIYPNPVTDHLQIRCEATADRIEIYGISGHLMMVKYDLTTVDLTDLPQGIYLLKLFSEGEVGMKRFMKI